MNTCSVKQSKLFSRLITSNLKKKRRKIMCRFKSGLIFKDRVVLTPIYNESHSTMLEKLGIEDTDFNARKVFVRAELLPYNDDLMSDVNKWEYIVDQDVTPDWYDDDPQKYEEIFRESVKEWIDNNIFIFCGQPCTKLKEENGVTYYHTCKPLFNSEFGDNNDYRKSNLRKVLLERAFVENLQKEYGELLVPVTIDLAALDGLKDYGEVTDVVGIPNVDLYRECRKNIFVGDDWWWLSTPDSTPSGVGSSGVQCVGDDGGVCWDDCRCSESVRPFFILKSSISVSLDGSRS